ERPNRKRLPLKEQLLARFPGSRKSGRKSRGYRGSTPKHSSGISIASIASFWKPRAKPWRQMNSRPFAKMPNHNFARTERRWTRKFTNKPFRILFLVVYVR